MWGDTIHLMSRYLSLLWRTIKTEVRDRQTGRATTTTTTRAKTGSSVGVLSVTQYRLHSGLHSLFCSTLLFLLAGQIDPELKEFMSTFRVKFGLDYWPCWPLDITFTMGQKWLIWQPNLSARQWLFFFPPFSPTGCHPIPGSQAGFSPNKKPGSRGQQPLQGLTGKYLHQSQPAQHHSVCREQEVFQNRDDFKHQPPGRKFLGYDKDYKYHTLRSAAKG